MVIYVIFGGALALLLALSFRAAKTASRVAQTNKHALTRLEDKIAEWRLSMQQELEAMASTQRMGAATEAQAGARESSARQPENRAPGDPETRGVSRGGTTFSAL